MLARFRTRLTGLSLSAACLAACQAEHAPTAGGGAAPALAAGASSTAGGSAAPSAGGAGGSGGGSANSGGLPGAAASSATSSGAAGTSGGNRSESGQGGSSAGTNGASGAVGTGGNGTSPFPAGVSKPRIMIVGDSISAGPGCYKKFLLQDLTDNRYSKFEFVGEYTDDCGSTVRHSAVSCSTAEQFTQATFTMPNCSQGKSFPGMSTLVKTHEPDLIMLQLGVNDVWNGKSVDAILANYATLLQQARDHNPQVVVVVARIQKIRPDCSSDDKLTKLAEMLVNAVPAWATSKSLPNSPVFVADLWTNSDWSKAETLDCVHPNDIGAEKMGMNWFNALKTILQPD
jgi:hypothetical protein